MYQLDVRNLLSIEGCLTSSSLKTFDCENLSAAPECPVLPSPNTFVSPDEETDTFGSLETNQYSKLDKEVRDSPSKVRKTLTEMPHNLEEIEKEVEAIYTLDLHITHSSGS